MPSVHWQPILFEDTGGHARAIQRPSRADGSGTLLTEVHHGNPLHNREGDSAHNIARAYTTVTTPPLGAFAGQPIAGNWTLKVSDHEAADVGKLNRWSVTIRRA